MIGALYAAQQAAPAIVQPDTEQKRLSSRQIVDNALARAGRPNGVTVQDVDRTHWLIRKHGKNRAAIAARDPEGGEWILNNTQANVPMMDREPLLQHEVAHLLAWRKYGEGIKEHGPEFAKICQEVVQRRQDEFCKRR